MVNYLQIEALVTKELRKSEFNERDIFVVAAAIRVALVQFELELRKQQGPQYKP